MIPRQTIVALFSTFIEFKSDSFHRWVTDTQLQRSIRIISQKSSENNYTESFWVVYCYKAWQSAPSQVTKNHLFAYLQEPCYWAARKSSKRFVYLNRALRDYFQIAISQTDTVLKGYRPDRGASLKSYASIVYPSLIRDKLRQYRETDGASDLALLRKVGKKRLGEALQQVGLNPAQISQYRLAWECFKAIYIQTQPGGMAQLPKLDRTILTQITELYNSERCEQLTVPGDVCSVETVEQWLTKMAQWIRNYLYPPIESLNQPHFGQDSGDMQDDLTAADTTLPLEHLVKVDELEARQALQNQVNTVLEQAIQKLTEECQQIIALYYCEGCNQTAIAKRIEISQPTVNRRLRASRKQLLDALIVWNGETMNNPVSPDLIKSMSEALEEWLKLHLNAHNHTTTQE